MKKSLILANILALFLTSCSSYQVNDRVPAAETSQLTCNELVSNIVTVKKPDAMKARLQSFVKLDLSDEEMSDFFKQFSDKNLSTRDEDMYRSIFLYAKEDADVRRNLFREFFNQQAGSGIDEENKVWSKFIAHKKRVEEKKIKILAKEKTKAGKVAAIEKAKIFEKLYYSCKTQIKGAPSPQVLKQAKHLTFALAAGGLGATTLSYSAVHWEEEKNKKWFNELYFTLGIGVVFSLIGGKLILANPKLSPWTGKMPLAFLNNTISDAGVSGVYAFMFKQDDAELEKKLKALESDPEAQAKIQELIKIAEDNNLFEKNIKLVQDMFRDKKTNKTMKTADFDHQVSIDDIDIEESRELLLQGLAEQEYIEKSGLMKTGYPAVDRFTYHRIYNLLSVPTNIGLTILMQNQMCMSADPKLGFMKAVGLYMGASVLMDALYFKAKKEMINQ